jgi:hypothetical protein
MRVGVPTPNFDPHPIAPWASPHPVLSGAHNIYLPRRGGRAAAGRGTTLGRCWAREWCVSGVHANGGVLSLVGTTPFSERRPDTSPPFGLDLEPIGGNLEAPGRRARGSWWEVAGGNVKCVAC